MERLSSAQLSSGHAMNSSDIGRRDPSGEKKRKEEEKK